ncbi:MAG TPA: hypothetical protein DEP87_00445 [Candidatus Pacebacteria bacterium]|nr:hypothetical protein [Candidatus Paceibacterota bacterium]
MVFPKEGPFTAEEAEAEIGIGFIKMADFIARLTVPNPDQSKSKKNQVIAYLASLSQSRADMIVGKIKFDANFSMFKVAIAEVRSQLVQQTEKESRVGDVKTVLTFGAMAGGAEITRRIELLAKGMDQEYFCEVAPKKIVAEIKRELDQELATKELKIIIQASSDDDVGIEITSSDGIHLLTVLIERSQRLSEFDGEPMEVTTVKISKSNNKYLAELSISHAVGFVSNLRAAMQDGDVDLAEGVNLFLQGAESIDKVGKKISLGEQIFGVMNTLLVESERKYKTTRRISQGQKYQDAKDAKDARICAGCGMDKVKDAGACLSCGMPYSFKS